MARILVIDDESSMLDLLRTVLTGKGHEVVTASRGKTGVARYKEDRPRVTLLDLKMPDMNGIDVLREIRGFDPDAQVIILTGAGNDVLEKRAKHLGAVDFLQNGFSLHALGEALRRALKE
ncbi:MAG: response regulator [Nitrospirae bacterium]|nr:response regulator [Nitrospirota bacterium]